MLSSVLGPREESPEKCKPHLCALGCTVWVHYSEAGRAWESEALVPLLQLSVR